MRKRNFLLVLAGNDHELARAEAGSLLGSVADKEGRLCRLSSPTGMITRLAYTREVHETLTTCPPSALKETLASVNITERTFLARTHRGISMTAGQAGADLKKANPETTVNLNAPEGEYHIFSFRGTCHITRLLWRNAEDFAGRRSHKRPGGCPISLHPRLARCMVNLTGIREGTLLDPCCGTGGMLIEAGLMGLRPVGYDIEPGMIRRSEEAMAFFNIDARLGVKDCRDIRQTFRYLVTDIPYGRNTAPTHTRFVPQFMDMLSHVVTRRAVISADSRQQVVIPKNCSLRHEFDYYIHKSLTKKLYVIDVVRKNTA